MAHLNGGNGDARRIFLALSFQIFYKCEWLLNKNVREGVGVDPTWEDSEM